MADSKTAASIVLQYDMYSFAKVIDAVAFLLQVVVIGKTAVGIGVQCDDPKCEWDSVPYMQNDYTSGHRQLMLDCLNITESEPSQQDTQVVIVQRLLSRGRSMLNILEVHDAIAETGAHVQVFSTEGEMHGKDI